MIEQGFTPTGATQNVAVTAISQAITLNSDYLNSDSVRLVNVGTQTVFVEVSPNASAPTASVTDSVPILANMTLTVTQAKAKFVSVVAGATGSTLYCTPGMGR